MKLRSKVFWFVISAIVLVCLAVLVWAESTGKIELFADSEAPVCSNVGTRSEGWTQNGDYLQKPGTSTNYYDQCNGCTAVCRNVGTRSEGWYSSCNDALLKYDDCSASEENNWIGAVGYNYDCQTTGDNRDVLLSWPTQSWASSGYTVKIANSNNELVDEYSVDQTSGDYTNTTKSDLDKYSEYKVTVCGKENNQETDTIPSAGGTSSTNRCSNQQIVPLCNTSSKISLDKVNSVCNSNGTQNISLIWSAISGADISDLKIIAQRNISGSWENVGEEEYQASESNVIEIEDLKSSYDTYWRLKIGEPSSGLIGSDYIYIPTKDVFISECDVKVCAQVITYAINPETGECKEFSTPCEVPDDWDKVSICPVTNFMATIDEDGNASLNWNHVGGATDYQIFMNDSTVPVSVGETKYTVSGLTCGENYSFYVVAAKGEETSTKSNTVNLNYECKKNTSEIDITQLKPENIIARLVSDDTIELTWDSVESASGYTVYNCEDNAIFTTSGTSITFQNLNYSTSYCFYVVAHNGAGEKSQKSDEVSIVTAENNNDNSGTNTEDKTTNQASSLVSTGTSLWLNITIVLALIGSIGYFTFKREIWKEHK